MVLPRHEHPTPKYVSIEGSGIEMLSPSLASAIEAEVFNPRWQPYRGFHDEHRGKDRTPDYLPAVQQRRDEFYALVNVLQRFGTKNMLQLGMGTTMASHDLWSRVFDHVVTIDCCICKVSIRDDLRSGVYMGFDTHSTEAIKFAERFQPYDFLFIDAGHKYDDVRMDFKNYGRMVRSGGVIAFHDALKRPTYEEEIEVWKFLDKLSPWKDVKVNMIGTEIGTAWLVRP